MFYIVGVINVYLQNSNDMNKKTVLYFDMDNVLVDFKSGLNRVPAELKSQYDGTDGTKEHVDDIPGIFSLMDPMPGAIEAVKKLAERYDVYILSTAPWGNPSAWIDKLQWVKKYFDEPNGTEEDNVFYKRLILSHHKNLCRQEGAYLIDDRPKHGASDFDDHWIQFGSERFPDWNAVVVYFNQKA